VGHQGPVQSLVILKPVPLPNELRRILTASLGTQLSILKNLRASLDNTIKLWDLNTGKLLSTLFGHSDGVWGIAGDTIRIVSASQDRSVKVWDLQTGTCVYTLTSHHSGVHGIWLTDTKLISGDREGIVSVRDFSMNR
jgi:F-box/WD-40 domain protein MET30